MLLISTRNLLLFLCASLVLLLTCGILGYYRLYPENEIQTDPKLAAEQLLYISIAGSLLLSLYFTRIYTHRIRVEKKLKRITTLGGTASPTLQLQSQNLGSLGVTLQHFYRNIMLVNEQQSLKLSGQSELISLLIANSDAPLAVTDITGTLLYASEKYEKKAGAAKSKLIGSSIEVWEEDVVVPIILREVESHRSFSMNPKKEETMKKGSFTVLPVINSRGTISYLLFDFRADSPLNKLKRNRGIRKEANHGKGQHKQ
ncbi:MAG: hypothetical protein R6V67_09515 [Spirochaetia bacterium]